MSVSMLLENNIWDRFTQTNVIVGLVLLVLGVILALVASKITKLIRKTDKIQSNDKIFLAIKAVALVIILASLIVMIVK